MSTAAVRRADPEYKNAMDQYSAAMKLFGQQKFDKAKPLLEKLIGCAYRELAERARTHLTTCELRLDGDTKATSSSDLYHHAVVKLNAGDYDAAETLLSRALKSGGKSADLAYLTACLRAQTHDHDAALAHLQEAIAGEPQYRGLARQDRDFQPLMDDPRFTEIIYPDGD